MDIESNGNVRKQDDFDTILSKDEERDEKLPRKSYLRQLAKVLLPQDSLFIAVFVYTLTGVISPTLIDYVSHTYQPDQWALLPVLATAIGLALVVPLNRLIDNASSSSASEALGGTTDIRQATAVAGLDLTATTLVTVGLVNVGSATFTVIYSSAAAWTAALSFYRGHPLARAQVLGVGLVTFGLFINGVGHVFEDDTRTEAGMVLFALSCLALLIGTVLHSVVMVRIDEFTRESKMRALLMASSMGRSEILVLLVWNGLRMMFSSKSTSAYSILPMGALVYFALLALNQSLHSLAFFSMIGRLGAVGSAVLKGFLALNTFGLAAALFCKEGHSEQCLTPLKSMSMLFVFVGGLIYGISSSKKKKKTVTDLPI